MLSEGFAGAASGAIVGVVVGAMSEIVYPSWELSPDYRSELCLKWSGYVFLNLIANACEISVWHELFGSWDSMNTNICNIIYGLSIPCWSYYMYKSRL